MFALLVGLAIAQDREKEAALGAALASDVRRSTTALDSAAIREYIERTGARLAAGLPRGMNYSFAVITDHAGGATREPMAIPGGYVFIPADLFLAAADESEFAGMLAHAMAHIAERHGTRAATRGQIENQASIPLIYVGSWNPSDRALIPAGFVAIQRDYELDADRLAVRMTSGAGYDPTALARYLNRVQPPDATPPDPFSALPPRDIRLANLQRSSENLTIPNPRPDNQFYAIQDEVRGALPVRVAPTPSLNRPKTQ